MTQNTLEQAPGQTASYSEQFHSDSVPNDKRDTEFPSLTYNEEALLPDLYPLVRIENVQKLMRSDNEVCQHITGELK